MDGKLRDDKRPIIVAIAICVGHSESIYALNKFNAIIRLKILK